MFVQHCRFNSPMCHGGISLLDNGHLPHQGRGFPFPDSFCVKGTEERKSTESIIPRQVKMTMENLPSKKN